MEQNEYKKMYDLESTYWWYVGRRSIIEEVLKKYVAGFSYNYLLDLGCGTGINFDIFKKFANHVVGIDNSSEALYYAHQRGFATTRLANIAKLDYADSSIGIITILDVLEHLPNEETVLREVSRILGPEGLLIITVPAYQFLWSEHDIALYHERRYTAGSIRSILEKNNFQIIKLSYIISFLLPLIISYRVLRGVVNIFYKSAPKTSHVILPATINNFFIFLLRTEAKLIRRFSLPAGTSILVVAKKKT